MLRRPCSVGLTQEVGLNAPIRSGVVEDLGPAALRYQLGEVLKVCERSIPTNAVSYSFPVNEAARTGLAAAPPRRAGPGPRQRRQSVRIAS